MCEVGNVQGNVNLIDLVKELSNEHLLTKFDSIQPRTSPLKFVKSLDTSIDLSSATHRDQWHIGLMIPLKNLLSLDEDVPCLAAGSEEAFFGLRIRYAATQENLGECRILLIVARKFDEETSNQAVISTKIFSIPARFDILEISIYRTDLICRCYFLYSYIAWIPYIRPS